MLTGEATTNVGADSLLTVALDKQLNLCSRVAACVLTGNLFPTSSLLLHYLHEEVENLFLGMTRLLYSDCCCCSSCLERIHISNATSVFLLRKCRHSVLGNK